MGTKGYIQTLDSLDFDLFCSSNMLYIYIFKLDEFLTPRVFSYCAIGFHRPSKIWFIKKFIEFSIEVVRESTISSLESRPRVGTLDRVPSRLLKFVTNSKFVKIISQIQIF